MEGGVVAHVVTHDIRKDIMGLAFLGGLLYTLGGLSVLGLAVVVAILSLQAKGFLWPDFGWTWLIAAGIAIVVGIILAVIGAASSAASVKRDFFR